MKTILLIVGIPAAFVVAVFVAGFVFEILIMAMRMGTVLAEEFMDWLVK